MIVIIDFGSQTAHLIGRRVRDIGVDVIIVEPEHALEQIRKMKPKGIILSGGPASVFEEGAPTIDKLTFNLGIPILGICYGWQLAAHLLGGKVKSSHKEYGPAILSITDSSTLLFKSIPKSSTVWVSHGTTVVECPTGFTTIGATRDVKYTAVEDKKRNIYGIQFHPEIWETEYGRHILKNFAVNICKIKLSKRNINIKHIISFIQQTVGKDKVIGAVSGGVDSTTTAALTGKAIGNQFTPIYIESGLMRKDTAQFVKKIFNKIANIEPVIINAEDSFLNKLKGVKSGEEKRKIIGKLYIELLEKEAKKRKGVKFLAQGTIYSDVIESKGTKHSDKIKSHHNVGGLPEKMKLKLLEPLRDFYKDEVKSIALSLGIPKEFIYIQKFPGPGAAIRIMGEVTKDRLAMQQHADLIVLEEMKKSGWYKKVFHSFTIATGTYSTALKGDGRAHLEVICVRILQSNEEMTATWAHPPYHILQNISSRIVNEVPQVSRVVYDITTKPPATMEWE